MNGKRARALRQVALDTACEMITPDPKDGTIPNLRYTNQLRAHYEPRNFQFQDVVQRRLGPCIRKVEKETKRAFNNLTR